MGYKRWRLAATPDLVNAAMAAAGLIFLASCSDGDSVRDRAAPQDAPDTGETANTLPTLPQRDAEGRKMFPAVWSTRPLDGPVKDLALARGGSPLLAIAYESRGLELFNLEAERMTERVGFQVTDIADGQFARIDDVGLTVFPGVDGEGELKAWVYGEGLKAPVEIDLPIELDTFALGACSAPPPEGSGALMRFAFWSFGDERRLRTGKIFAEDGSFTWEDDGYIGADAPIAACQIARTGTELAPEGTRTIATFTRGDDSRQVVLREDGELLAGQRGKAPDPFGLRDGITVAFPETPTAMSALGIATTGGYPEGLIVVAGETEPGIHRAVFVDPTGLLDPLP